MRKINKALIILISILLIPLSSMAQYERPRPIEFEMKWLYSNFPFKMRLHEVDPSIPLWNMGTSKKLPQFVKDEIPKSKIEVAPGQRKKFALVFFNHTNETKYFFASPHEINPAEFSLGFKYNCLCMNHAYRVAPKSYWYRSVELRVGNKYRNKKPVAILHTMVGLTPEEGKMFLDPSAAEQ